jgi:CheY-like chemotaxis protein
VNDILFIDDEPGAMRYYVDVLKATGFQVTQCTGPDAALDVLRRGHMRFSAAILDIMMSPGEAYAGQDTHEGLTTGVYLFRDLRRLSPNLPVVILTNVANPETLQLIQPDRHVRVTAKVTCSPHELVEDVLHSLGVVCEQRIHEFSNLLDGLRCIPPGPEHAAAYHGLVFRILAVVFDGQLSSGTKEKEIHEGRKRVDIVFRNSAENGFFADLIGRHQIKCPYVFFECKNYTEEIENPEFDQLTGRFSDKRGMFGIMVCRRIRNKARLRQRCRDIIADNRGYVLALDDRDLAQLLDVRANEEAPGVSRVMHDLLAYILL